MLFDVIPGLLDTKKHLIDMQQSGKIPHALMFMGKKGAPVLPMALAFAQQIVCEQVTEYGVCHACQSCRLANRYQHPDISFMFPIVVQPSGKKSECSQILPQWRDFLEKQPYGGEEEWKERLEAAKNLVIPVDVSREVVNQLSLTPFGKKYKIVICWMTEKMNISAANALLKLIEEPPKDTVMIFCTESIEKILLTIQSRTQKVFIPQFNEEELTQVLTQYTEGQAAEKIANAVFYSDFEPNRAIKYLDNADFEQDIEDLFWNFLRLCYKREFESIMTWNLNFQARGKQEQALFFNYALRTVSEIINQFAGVDINFTSEKHAQSVKGIAQSLNENTLMRLARVFEETRHYIERHGSVKLQMMNLSFQIAKLF